MACATVLVVDDDAPIVEVVTMALESEGYTVISALGPDALRAAAARRPDLILLDLMMPDVDGAEMSRRLRDDRATAEIPIVLMSAIADLGAVAATLPVQGQLPKPFDLDALYATVAHWISEARCIVLQ
jgi:CheY-like chemotaxis protein